MTRRVADMVEDLESQLHDAEQDNRRLSEENSDLANRLQDAEWELEELDAFYRYAEKTNPELITAWEAAKKLEGETK